MLRSNFDVHELISNPSKLVLSLTSQLIDSALRFPNVTTRKGLFWVITSRLDSKFFKKDSNLS